MAKKSKKTMIWMRKKDYYEFLWYLRVPRNLFMVAWTMAKVAFGAALVALAVVLITSAALGKIMGDYLQDEVIPNSEFNVENFDLDRSSFIHYVDRDTQKIYDLQQIYTTIDRVWVPYENIPQDLVHAAVAIEDKRFFQHQGVDWFTTTKACFNMFLGSRSTFGGSTITQQLIKNLTEEDDVTVRRKVTEIFRALQFEERYTKEEIMEWYLNTIYLGETCYGVQTAARTYFGKDVQDLTAAECASLISITNNPSLFDPYIDEERNRERQLIVLDQMNEQGYLTDEAYEEAVNQEMVFTSVYQKGETYTCPNCGKNGPRNVFKFSEETQTYSCPSCGTTVDIPIPQEDFYTYFEDTVIRDVCNDLMDKYGYTYKVAMQTLKTGGYHIYTTVDPKIQDLVDSVYEDLSRIPTVDSNQQLQSAIVVIDNATGDIVALSGGVGKKETYLGFNRATQSTLQPGSAIKPISVYAPGMDLGIINPATVLFDGPLFDDYPKNYDWTYIGNTTVLDGVSQSMNTLACRVVEAMGYGTSFEYTRDKFGISTLVESEEINGAEKTDKALAPLSMGALTYGVTVRNLTTAFATFTNGGVWRESRTYLKVLDSDGNVVLDNTQDTRRVVSEKAANYMNYMLDYAVNYGTASPARIPGMSVAGKTGTTTDDNDRWFAGYTPYYTAVVWCGFDQPESIYLTENYTNPSARLWHAVMEPLHEGLEDKPLYDSQNMRTVAICTESGLLATDACYADPRGHSCVMNVSLYPEDVPDQHCNLHVMTPYCEAGRAPAGPFCGLIPGNHVVNKGLVKMTDELKQAYASAGLDYSSFLYPESDGRISKCPIHSIAPPKPTEPPKPSKPEKPDKPADPPEPVEPAEPIPPNGG